MGPVSPPQPDVPPRAAGRAHARAGSRVVLDDEQRRVVDHAGGPLLVLAGPGTGKTTTLVEAIVRPDRGRAPRPTRSSR